MKKMLLILFFFIQIFNHAFSQESQFGKLLVIAEEGYRVYVDNDLKGLTDDSGYFTVDHLEEGNHLVKLKNSQKELTKDILVIAGKFQEIDFTSQLVIIQSNCFYEADVITRIKNIWTTEQEGKRYMAFVFDKTKNSSTGKVYIITDVYGDHVPSRGFIIEKAKEAQENNGVIEERNSTEFMGGVADFEIKGNIVILGDMQKWKVIDEFTIESSAGLVFKYLNCSTNTETHKSKH